MSPSPEGVSSSTFLPLYVDQMFPLHIYFMFERFVEFEKFPEVFLVIHESFTFCLLCMPNPYKICTCLDGRLSVFCVIQEIIFQGTVRQLPTLLSVVAVERLGAIGWPLGNTDKEENA